MREVPFGILGGARERPLDGELSFAVHERGMQHPRDERDRHGALLDLETERRGRRITEERRLIRVRVGKERALTGETEVEVEGDVAVLAQDRDARAIELDLGDLAVGDGDLALEILDLRSFALDVEIGEELALDVLQSAEVERDAVGFQIDLPGVEPRADLSHRGRLPAVDERGHRRAVPERSIGAHVEDGLAIERRVDQRLHVIAFLRLGRLDLDAECASARLDGHHCVEVGHRRARIAAQRDATADVDVLLLHRKLREAPCGTVRSAPGEA